MSRKSVLLVSALLTLVLLSPAASAQHKGQDVGEAPFSLNSDRIVVQVKIMGKGPYNMIIRTGIAHSYVDLSVAKETGAAVVPLPLMPGVNKGVALGALVQLKEMEVGSYQRKVLLAIVQDFSDFNAGEQRLSVPVQGLLGFNFLNSKVVQIDYPKKALRFLAGPPYDKNDAGGGKVGRYIIPFQLSLDNAFPVIADVYVGGKKIKAVIDTGYGGMFALTPRAMKSMGLPTSGEVLVRVGMTPEISLTPEVVPDGSYQDKPPEVYGAMIGAKFLSAYVLTLDSKSKTVTLEKP